MIKNQTRFFTLLLLLICNLIIGQQRNNWSRISESEIDDIELQERTYVKKFKSYELNLTSFQKNLEYAPNRNNFLGTSNVKVDFPDANGNLITYHVKEAPVMSSALAKKYPGNKSYVGVSEKDKNLKIRFSVNELGVNAIITSGKGPVQFIEPVSKNKTKYKIFYKSDAEAEHELQCVLEKNTAQLKPSTLFKNTDDGILRVYRLALAANSHYAEFHVLNQNAENESDEVKKAIVLAAMTTAITQINAVFENDLAVTFQLIDNNDELIYLDPDTDPYSNDNGGFEMLGENQINCDAVIGSGNYDIGHVFGTGFISAASLGIVCNNSAKARGATGNPSPIGESFYFNFVAHELGHQFGANHTFNGDEGSCGQAGQRQEETAVEPGSGTTIMAYAGVCFSQNIQDDSDLYFHTVSIEEIRDFIVTGSGGNCAQEIDLTSNNNVPLVNAGDDFMIPIGTAYKLIGSGSDADGDQISFAWEQVDNGVTIVPPSENANSGALYRSIPPSDSPIRYLPQLKTLVTGETSSTWEVTPNVAREINFTLTVRDNNAEAGQVNTDDLAITVTDAAGPFLVSSQDTEDIVWTGGSEETITWDVAGTNSNGINVSQVNILLSTDGGKNFDTVLASGVSNDGSQVITVPDTKASQCFVIVEAVGNFFFAMNSTKFSIGAFNEVCNSYSANDTPLAIPDGDVTGVSSTINVSENVTVENIIVRLINQANPSDIASPGITHTYIGDLSISLESPEGTVIDLIQNACNASEDIQVELSDQGDPLSCDFSPGISGIKKPAEELAGFNGENAQGNWILKIIDGEDVDTGFLEAWSIEICSSEPVLAVNNFVFEDFKVFPNPSDGVFNIKFQSEETSDVEIIVYDLLGRKIVRENFTNLSNRFDESLDLENVAGGIYILSVKRGNKMSSHKIRLK